MMATIKVRFHSCCIPNLINTQLLKKLTVKTFKVID